MSKSLDNKRNRRITALNILKAQLGKGNKPVKKSDYVQSAFPLEKGQEVSFKKGNYIDFMGDARHVGKPLKRNDDGIAITKNNSDGTTQPELLDSIPLSSEDEIRIKKEIVNLEKKIGYAI